MSKTLDELCELCGGNAYITVTNKQFCAMKTEIATREAELVAEVAKYREALRKIDKQASIYSTTQHLGDIARNALGEG